MKLPAEKLKLIIFLLTKGREQVSDITPLYASLYAL